MDIELVRFVTQEGNKHRFILDSESEWNDSTQFNLVNIYITETKSVPITEE